MSIYSLLDRLMLWQKFAILSAVAFLLAAIPIGLYLFETNKDLYAAEQEMHGLAPVAMALKVVQLTQQHRALSALALGGVDGAQAQREAKQQEADQAYREMSELAKRVGSKEVVQAWDKAQQEWLVLREKIGSGQIAVPESYAGHSALIPRLVTVSELVSDHFGLSLDPDVDTYQLIQAMFYVQPYLTEELGKMRAKGAALLAKRSASQEERQALAAIIARAGDRLAQLTSSFNKSVAANSEIQNRLGGKVQEAQTLAKQAMHLATSRIVAAEVLDFSSVEYVELTTQTIDAQFKGGASAMRELETMLAAKIDNFRMARWLMLATTLALLLLGGLIQYLIARSVSMPLASAVAISQRVAEGDLTMEIPAGGRSETAQLLRALKFMNESLRRIVGEVRGSIDNISAATQDIASGNADLSVRTEAQASNLEQTAASIEEIASTVKQNADSARQASDLVANTAVIACKGGDVVSQVVTNMGAINESSRKVVEIISVIDGIAFQTNILALNAAVEAARAGEQGRGFAVVASEVRNLAQRSAAAAKEIKLLIGDSVQKVDAGNRLVESAGQAMDEIVAGVRHAAEIMAEIVNASMEQSAGVEQVNQAVSHMDQMTQQNAALVEEAAAAAESLNEQAHLLGQSMAVFQLDSRLVQSALGLAHSVPRRSPAEHGGMLRLTADRPKRQHGV